MAKNSQGKTNFAKKAIIILILGVILGISCIFSAQMDKLLGIGYRGSHKGDVEVVYASDLIISYIDVGQGDSTYIEFPNGETMLIDASVSTHGTTVVNYIKSRQGLEESEEPVIDYLILTHSDADHSGGMTTVFEECVINNIYRPFQLSLAEGSTTECAPFEDLSSYKTMSGISKVSSATYRKFIELAYKEKNEQGELATKTVFYDTLNLGSEEKGFSFEFFMPQKLSNEAIEDNSSVYFTKGFPVESYDDNNNNNSPVMLLEYKEFSFVFTGDAEKEVEEEFLNTLSTDEKIRFNEVDVFQAGHHGSSTSNSAKLMELINPTYTVVSCGEGNEYGHPTDKFLKTINSLKHRVDDYLLRTDTNGTIVFGAKDDTLIYCAGVEVAVGKVVHWYHIAIVLFIGLSIVIISIKFKSDGLVTKTSVRKGARNAKKVVKRYFD